MVPSPTYRATSPLLYYCHRAAALRARDGIAWRAALCAFCCAALCAACCFATAAHAHTGQTLRHARLPYMAWPCACVRTARAFHAPHLRAIKGETLPCMLCALLRAARIALFGGRADGTDVYVCARAVRHLARRAARTNFALRRAQGLVYYARTRMAQAHATRPALRTGSVARCAAVLLR